MVRERKQINSWVIICLFAIISLLLGFWLQIRAEKKHSFHSENSSTLPIAIPLKPFHLTDDQGKPFTNNNLIGHWSLLFFGYTHCPSVCPTLLRKLNNAYQLLQALKTHMAPQVIFISLDPKRDNSTQIRQYLDQFNQNFIGVTGTQNELNTLTKSLGIAHFKTASSNQSYDFQHSAIIIIVNPNAEWVGLIRSSASGSDIAKDFQSIQKAL